VAGRTAAGIVTGQWADPRAGRETVIVYGERWLARQMIAPSTAGAYRTVLNNHIYTVLGPLRLDAITRADVQALVKDWASGAAPRTVEGRYSVLAILLRAAVKAGSSRHRRASTSSCPRSSRSPRWSRSRPKRCSPSARPSRPAIAPS
jgi:hypothetical protein